MKYHILVFSIFAHLVTILKTEYIEGSHLEWFLLEELPADIVIGNVAVDTGYNRHFSPELVPFIRHRFVSSNGTREDLFEMDTTTSLIKTATKIDRDDPTLCAGLSVCVVWLKVVSSLVPTQHSTTPPQVVDIRVEIVDINDNSPEWQTDTPRHQDEVHHTVALTIPENSSIGSRFRLPDCRDPDADMNYIQSYELLNNDDDTFQLLVNQEPPMDTIFLEVAKNLDRETRYFYSLTVTATDGGIEKHHASIIVAITVLDVNDNSPSFDKQRYDISVPEHASTGVIAFVTASDPDSGVRGEITYRLSDEDNSDEVKNIFSIDSKNGKISIESALDFEEGALYVLDIEAVDDGYIANTGYTTVIVRVEDINDNSPLIQVNTLTGMEYARVEENCQPDTIVAQIYVSDPDGGENGHVTCNLRSPHFKLYFVEDTQYRLVTTQEKIDREVDEEFQLSVTCHDGGVPRREEILQLTVEVKDQNDNTPAFNQRRYQSLVVLENESADDEWSVRVYATDNDVGLNGMVRYEMHAEVRHTFLVDPHTGVITTAPLIDVRDNVGIEFRVLAHDMGTRRLTSTATVTLVSATKQDLLPIFDEDSFSFGVYENEPLASTVDVTTVYSQYFDTNLLFSLDLSEHASSFSIESSKGVISTNAILDRERQSVYYFSAFVTAKDSSLHTGKIEIDI